MSHDEVVACKPPCDARLNRFTNGGILAVPPIVSSSASHYRHKSQHYRVLEALREPTAENAEWREWIGKCDPEAFSVGKVNRLWAGWRKRRRG